MNRTLCYLLIAFLCLTLHATTAPTDHAGTPDQPPTRALGLTYTLISGNTAYAVSRGTATATEIIIPPTHNFLPVTMISQSAFAGFTHLTSIFIPEGITTIGLNAFKDCSGLTGIAIPSSTTNIEQWLDWPILDGCNNITSLTVHPDNPVYRSEGNCIIERVSGTLIAGCQNSVIPSSVRSINTYAFYQLPALTTINIPEGVLSIADNAFYECRNLSSVTISSSVASVGVFAFFGCWGLTNIEVHPNNPTYRSEGNCLINQSELLLGCQASVIPNSVTVIGPDAFYQCLSLVNIVIPNSVDSIEESAFQACYYLQDVTIANGLTTIGQNAFHSCFSLTSIYIPNSVMSIGEQAFYDCSSLENVTLSSNLETIEQYTFYNCENLRSITIPEGVAHIRDMAFVNCGNVTSITLPNSLISIGIRAFDTQSMLWSIYLPNNIETIGANAFFSWRLTIFTDLTVAPAGWDPLWNGYATVVWGGGSGGLAFSLIANETEYAVSCGSSRDANITIPAYYNDLPVTRIPMDAFSGLVTLVSVSIPATVNSINSSAFADCQNLINIVVDPANTMYRSEGNCIIEIESNTVILGCPASIIPTSADSIGPFAFNNCSALVSITIPANVSMIGSHAFARCSSLASVNILEGISFIDFSAFTGCSSLQSITLPTSISIIGAYAFEECSSLTNINLPSQLSNMSMGMLYRCTSLESIVIPETVTVISEGAFEGCTSLTSINIPSNVNSIGRLPFAYCSSLISITVDANNAFFRSEGNCLIRRANNTLLLGLQNSIIPDGVTSIDEYAFVNCVNLTSITIPSSVTSIGRGAFVGCINLDYIEIQGNLITIAVMTFSNCQNLSSITIPSSVTSIGGMAFNNCTNLTNIEIPAGVTSIGARAFADCVNLTNIIIPHGLLSIGMSAFSGCTGLQYATIPNSVEIIEWRVFQGCSSMVIFTEHESRPSGWVADWNNDNYIPDRNVVWGYTTEPVSPTNLAYRLNNNQVSLAWTQPVGAFIPYFESYTVYRDGEPLAGDLTNPNFVDISPVADTHEYYVCATYTNGVSAPSNTVTVLLNSDHDIVVRPEPELVGNYPNPFNPTTTIAFYLPREGRVVIEVYNTKGQKVTTLIDDVRGAGGHKVVWNGYGVSSGVYFYRMVSGEYIAVQKMLLLK